MQCAWIQPWVSPVHDTITPLKEYGHIGIEQGVFEYASYCLVNRITLMWIAGSSLPFYLIEAEECIRLCQGTKQELARLITALFTQAALNLSEKSAQATKLEGKWFSEERMLPSLEGNGFILTFYRLLKMTLSYLFGDSLQAYGHIDELLKSRATLFSHYVYGKISFYGALSCIARLPYADNDVESREMLEKLELFEGELKLWAQSAPMNSQHQYESIGRDELSDWRDPALYNAGNAAFDAGELEVALDFYTQALLGTDGDPGENLLFNLELTQRLLEQQQQQEQQQDKSGDQDKPQQDQQDQSQENQQQQDQQDQEKQDQQQQDQQQSEEQKQEQPQPQDAAEDQPEPAEQPAEELEQQMTPEEAMRLLQALDADEEQLRKSIQRRLRGDEKEAEHDW
jgi:hypothetical protein